MKIYHVLLCLFASSLFLHLFSIYKCLTPYAVNFLDGNENSLWDKKKDRSKIVITIFMFIIPIYCYISLKHSEIENDFICISVLSLLIVYSVYFAYANYFKIWKKTENYYHLYSSKSDDTDLNKYETNDVFKSSTISDFEVDKDICIKENNKEIEVIINDTDEIYEFSSFFMNHTTFSNVIDLLKENNFYSNKRKPDIIPVCVLLCKLNDLKIIELKYGNKNNTFESAKAFFDIKEGDYTNLSQALKELRDLSEGSILEYYKNLNYLENINKR